MTSLQRIFSRLSQFPPVLWNTLTGVLLAGSLCACSFFTLVFFNPQSALNPLRPPTRTPLPSATPASPQPLQSVPTLPPAWTPTPAGAAGTPATLPPTSTAGPAVPTRPGSQSTPTAASSPTLSVTTPAGPTPAAATATPTPAITSSATPGGYPLPGVTPRSGYP